MFLNCVARESATVSKENSREPTKSPSVYNPFVTSEKVRCQSFSLSHLPLRKVFPRLAATGFFRCFRALTRVMDKVRVIHEPHLAWFKIVSITPRAIPLMPLSTTALDPAGRKTFAARHDRAADPVDRRRLLFGPQAALHPDQGHQSGRRGRPAYAVHDQQGRSGHHRPAGRDLRRGRGQYRQLPPRPEPARRRRHRAALSGRAVSRECARGTAIERKHPVGQNAAIRRGGLKFAPGGSTAAGESPALRQPDTAEDQRQRRRMKKLKTLGQDQHGKRRAENRHEIDEQSGPVAADQAIAPDVECLGENGRKDRGIGDHQPALRIGPSAEAGKPFDNGEDRGGKQGAGRQCDHGRLPMQFRHVAESHGISPIGRDREQHQPVAGIDLQRTKPLEASLSGDERHAGDREKEPGNLRMGRTDRKKQEVAGEDNHRYRGLKDGRIDRGGEIQSGVKADIEPGKTDHPHDKQIAQVPGDGGPFGSEMPVAERKQDRKREDPAHRRQQHRRYMTGREFTRDRIAAPKKRGHDQQQAGGAIHRKRLSRRGIRRTRAAIMNAGGPQSR